MTATTSVVPGCPHPVAAPRWGESSGRAAITPKTTFRTVSRLSSNSAPPRAKLQFPKIPLALGGGMWHTISVLPVKRRDNRLPARVGRMCRDHCFEKVLGKAVVNEVDGKAN